MTPSQALRRAALGPTPRNSYVLWMWTRPNDKAHAAAVAHLVLGLFSFFEATDAERRMFLLFVAEAIE